MATASKTIVKTGNARLFVMVGGAGPGRQPLYVEYGKPGALRWPISEPTDIEVPNPDAYDDFIVVDSVKGARQKPQLPWTNRLAMGQVSVFRQMREDECPADVQVHYGICENPRDFNGGYQLVHVLEGARTDYNTDELGALQSSERNPVNESGTFTGQVWYDIVPVTFAEQNAAGVTVELVDITICDTPACSGTCGAGSDGCQKVYALSLAIGASAGVQNANLVWSDDGGSTWNTSVIASLAIADLPNALACVGSDIAVVSADDEAHHWTPTSDVLSGTATWAQVTSGYVATKGPRAIFSLGPTLTWIAAEGGYVYFAADIRSGVEVQDAGNGTVEDLNAIHGVDANNVVAVGANNAVVRTTNGGVSWAAITGPAVGDALTAVVMKSPLEWLVGTGAGQLFYTGDGGVSWAEIAFSGSGAGVVNDIAFSRSGVGWLAHQSDATKGRILRSIDGGASWVLPTGINAIGQNDKINALATCRNANRVFGAGLADNGTDGYLVLGA